MSKPLDTKLYERVKKKIYNDMPINSAYRSGLIVKTYKEKFKKKYGDKPAYTGKSNKLKNWFAERWTNERGETGYKYKSDIYRPNIRINKNTPKTFKELTKKEIERARREKQRTGRVKKF